MVQVNEQRERTNRKIANDGQRQTAIGWWSWKNVNLFYTSYRYFHSTLFKKIHLNYKIKLSNNEWILNTRDYKREYKVINNTETKCSGCISDI